MSSLKLILVFFYLCVCVRACMHVCVYVCVCAHTLVYVCGFPTKYSPLYFLSKYL